MSMDGGRHARGDRNDRVAGGNRGGAGGGRQGGGRRTGAGGGGDGRRRYGNRIPPIGAAVDHGNHGNAVQTDGHHRRSLRAQVQDLADRLDRLSVQPPVLPQPEAPPVDTDSDNIPYHVSGLLAHAF